MDGKQETVTENSVFTLSELNKTLEFHCNTLSHICLWHYISGKKKKNIHNLSPKCKQSIICMPISMGNAINCELCTQEHTHILAQKNAIFEKATKIQSRKY